MHRRDHRDGLLGDIDTGEDFGQFRNARQAFLQQIGAEMLEMEIDMVLVGADAAALVDLDGFGAADHVARCQILGGRRVALHETLALRVA